MNKVVTGTYDEDGNRGPPGEQGDEFDAFARALAEALRSKYRGQENARDFAKRCSVDVLPHLIVRDVLVRTRDAIYESRERIVETSIEIHGLVTL